MHFGEELEKFTAFKVITPTVVGNRLLMPKFRAAEYGNKLVVTQI